MITYRRADIPDGLEWIDDVEITVKWETILESDEALGARFNGVDELNALFQKKLDQTLSEKNAVCGLVRSEKVTHSVNYRINASVMVGEYTVSLYGTPAK